MCSDCGVRTIGKWHIYHMKRGIYMVYCFKVEMMSRSASQCQCCILCNDMNYPDRARYIIEIGRKHAEPDPSATILRYKLPRSRHAVFNLQELWKLQFAYICILHKPQEVTKYLSQNLRTNEALSFSKPTFNFVGLYLS
jgi:hypothetical protein